MNCMQWLSCVHIITITRHGNLTGEPLWPRRLSIEIQQAYVLISIYIYTYMLGKMLCFRCHTPGCSQLHIRISIKQEYRWHVTARIRSRFECTTLAFMYIYVYIYIFVYIYIYIYIPAAVILIVEHTTTACREYLYRSDVYIHKNSCLMHVCYCGSSSAHQALHSAPRKRAKESVLKLLAQAGAKQTSPYVLTPCPRTHTWRRTERCKSIILR